MAGNQKNRSSTSWWLIINTTILHRNVTMKQKQKKRKLADGKTREREREREREKERDIGFISYSSQRLD